MIPIAERTPLKQACQVIAVMMVLTLSAGCGCVLPRTGFVALETNHDVYLSFEKADHQRDCLVKAKVIETRSWSRKPFSIANTGYCAYERRTEAEIVETLEGEHRITRMTLTNRVQERWNARIPYSYSKDDILLIAFDKDLLGSADDIVVVPLFSDSAQEAQLAYYRMLSPGKDN